MVAALNFDRKSDRTILADEAGAQLSLYGLLAGLTFTASVLIFSNRPNLPSNELFLTLSLVATVLFIFAAMLNAEVSSELARNNVDNAKQALEIGETFGVVGFFFLITEIIFIAFFLGWEYGLVVVFAIIFGFYYLVKKYLNRVIKATIKKEIK